MNIKTKQVLFWAPRILCILFSAILSMFALFDAFNDGNGFRETIFALLIHLAPAFLVVITLVIAWRWEWIGAILFSALALFYLVWSGRIDWSLVISGPLFFIGILFLLNWVYKNNIFRRVIR